LKEQDKTGNLPPIVKENLHLLRNGTIDATKLTGGDTEVGADLLSKLRLLYFASQKKKDTNTTTEKSPEQTAKDTFAMVELNIVHTVYNQMQMQLVKCICDLTEFAKCLPQFISLNLNDQVVLLKYGSYEAMFVLLGTLIMDEGMLLPLIEVHMSYNFFHEMGMYNLMKEKFEFAEKIRALDLNDEEMALFIAVIILCSDRPGLSNSKKVEQIQEEMLNALKYQLSKSHPNKPRLFAHLLMKLTTVRQLVADHVTMIENMKHLRQRFPPLLNEIFSNLH